MMTKEEVLAAFETDFTNPGSRDGWYLREHVPARAQLISSDDRAALTLAMREWIRHWSVPKTMLAVEIVAECGLTELRDDLQTLLANVRSQRQTGPNPLYVERLEQVLRSISVHRR